MGFVFLVSIIFKGIGAILEVAIQVVITKQIGVSQYGVYSALINAADLIYWCLFSGMVKCNTFYLSEQGATIRSFKKKYYVVYVLPVCCVGIAASIFLKRYSACAVFLITLAELLVMDQSSSLMARKQSKRALFGEYVLGRTMLFFGVIVLFQFSCSDILLLVFLYFGQFVLISMFFSFQRIQAPHYTEERQVSMKKWGQYQRADIIQSMIVQMPVVLQYFFVGAFEAGVVSVVMIVKKLVNFISGPSFKVFLPEFSRLYKEGNRDGIKKSFESIIRMQMLFLAPMTVILVGFPQLLLKVMAEELVDYVPLFILCAVTFLVIASLGPCSGMMQMTGNEIWDNRFREIAFAGMIIVFVVMRRDPFFVLYGLCVQTIIENTGKVIFTIRWMGGMPMRLTKYLSLWLLPGGMVALSYFMNKQDSYVWMILLSGITFLIGLMIEIKEGELLQKFKKKSNSSGY